MRFPPGLLLLLLPVTGPAWADIAPMPVAVVGDPAPRGKAVTPWRMAREEVQVELFEGFAVVDALFDLEATGPAPKLAVGFPGEGTRLEGGRNQVHRPLLGFRAWVEKAPQPVKAESIEHVTRMGPEGHTYTKRRKETWHTFQLKPARKGTKRRVRVRYAVLADPHRGDGWSSDEAFVDGSVHYVLATGAGWAGDIGEAAVFVVARPPVSLDAVRIRELREPEIDKRPGPDAAVTPRMPPGATRTMKALRVGRTSLEPETGDNLQIVFANPSPRRAVDGFPAERAKVEAAALAEAGR
ncbi:MAG: hypothetical protein RL653_4362 [Pseudomonadota bacterium]|jgi:hypothetical protein